MMKSYDTSGRYSKCCKVGGLPWEGSSDLREAEVLKIDGTSFQHLGLSTIRHQGRFGVPEQRDPVKTPGRDPVVLIIDDDPNNLAIVSSYLSECNYTILAAEDGESGVRRAQYAKPDLILLDIMMPGIDGYETCRRLKAQDATREVPVICMTALSEIQHKVKGFEAGAVDYVTKPFQREEVLARVGVHLRLRELALRLKESNDSLERRVVERTAELERVNQELQREVAQHKQTEEALRGSERKFHAIFDQAFQLMGLMTPQGRLLETNRTSLDFSDRDEVDLIDHLFWEAPWWGPDPALRTQLRDAVAKAATGELVRFEVADRGSDGNTHYFDFSIKPVRDQAGEVVLLIPEGRDITDRRNLSEQLKQSQKMEAIGTLAGGIAHDFNNILTAIIGFGSMLGLRLGDAHPLKQYVNDILAASERAANLTRSLLSFSRKQIIDPGPERLNEIVRRIDKFLMRIIGEDIEFKTVLTDEDLVVLADSGQIEQVLMNLAANARDAMPDGGVLLVTTERVEVDKRFAGSALECGSYAVISVTDNGEGIDDTTKQRIFEPFFTTKEIGKGTGLGLSIVYSIIHQHKGEIHVNSEPGFGTTFKIYLKLIDSAVQAKQVTQLATPEGGSEVILVAEDDPSVRSFMTHTLTAYGYRVIEAVDGEDALRCFARHKDEIDLLVLDVVMPKVNGREVYERIRGDREEIRVLFSSGYTADIISRKGALDEGINFISKPVTPQALLTKVREILGPTTAAAMAS